MSSYIVTMVSPLILYFITMSATPADFYSITQVGARLISHAGSLTNLAKYPASTVQILGAEKALFRYNCRALVVMAVNWVPVFDMLAPAAA